MSLNSRFSKLEKERKNRKNGKKFSGQNSAQQRSDADTSGGNTANRPNMRRGNRVPNSQKASKKEQPRSDQSKPLPRSMRKEMKREEEAYYGNPKPAVQDEKKVTRFGPRPAFANTNNSGYANVDIEISPNANRIIGLATSVILNCINKIGYKADVLYSAHYAARYLAEWWLNKWAGVVPPYNVGIAPAIVYDIMIAGMPKKIGNRSIHMKSVSMTWFDTIPQYFGFNLGNISGSGSGYDQVVCTFGAYTALSGYNNLIEIFQAAAGEYDVVTFENYKTQIEDDDVSFFSHFMPRSTGIFSISGWKTNNNFFSAQGLAVNGFPIKTQWLARITCNTDSTGIGFSHSVVVRGAPPTIIFLRMKEAWRGRHNHDKDATVLWYNGNDFARILDALLKRAIDIGGTNPFTAVGTETQLDDFKIAILNCLQRWCHTWAPAGAGSYVTVTTTGDTFAFGSGTGQHIQPGALTMKFPQVVVESLSRVFAYSRDSTYYYPLPFFPGDITVFTTTFAGAGGFFTAAYNWLTQLVGAATTVSIVSHSGSDWSLFTNRWDRCMASLAPYLPMALPPEESDVNCGCYHAIVDASSSSLPANSIITFSELPDHFTSLLYTTQIPTVVVSSTSETRVNEAMVFYNAKLATSIYADSVLWTTIAGAMMGSTHPSAGFGDPSGLVGSSPPEHEQVRSAKREHTEPMEIGANIRDGVIKMYQLMQRPEAQFLLRQVSNAVT